jgi:hypothetical protein
MGFEAPRVPYFMSFKLRLGISSIVHLIRLTQDSIIVSKDRTILK